MKKFYRPCATCTPPAWRSLPSASTFVPLWSITRCGVHYSRKFDWYRQQALDMGFSYCASGPMVRSSYLADEALGSVRLKRQVSAKA